MSEILVPTGITVRCQYHHLKRLFHSWVLALLIGFGSTFVPLASIYAQSKLPLKAPDVSFSIEGKDYRISDFENRRVMLWFLSTWCTTCIQAVKALQEIQPELEASGLLVVVLKNFENGGYPGPTIHDFINQYAATLNNAPNWMIGNASAVTGATYNPRRYPDIYFLIDEKSTVVAIEGAPAVTLDTIMKFARGNTENN